MDLIVVGLAALGVSALTLFSGFGLGTLLMPVFALFFPIELAVAATALVHGANSILKALLLGRGADFGVVLRFGLPAIFAAFGGAYLLGMMSGLPPVTTYTLLGATATITPIKIAMSALMLGFALFELLPRFRALTFPRSAMPVGGLLSGFFGGLSGHQGALRSAFLAKSGLSTPAFVGTNAVIGLLVDLARLSVYGMVVFGAHKTELFSGRVGHMVLVGVAAAFAGVLVGKRLAKKTTMSTVQTLTGVLLLLIALLLGVGLI